MVENKSSINNTLSFGAKSVNPEILEKLLVGRQNTSAYLLDAVKSIVNDRDNQFILVVGQRGMGKTHLLRVLHHNIQDFIKENKIVVAYFSEEEYGIDNYFDFLIRIFNAFMRWNEGDKPYLKTKISELQEIGTKANREHYAESIIEEYLNERPLLILAENFADILESIKPKEQAKLRAWLYKVNKISIIATSQAISKDFDSEDRPFYGFFNTYYLKKLSYEDTLSFLIQLAEIDERKDVVDFINNKGKGQIKALHQLVKGNHRLLVTFYQFLKTNTLVKLSENFIKTINDLKPYYETYIRYLPAQQQKILRYIALKRKPQLGIDISKNCFIDQKSATKGLSELTKKNLIETITNPSNKRNKLYDINEPLLRISIEVGEHREGITALFIDFLAIYYSEQELTNRKENILQKFKACKVKSEKKDLNFEIQAIDKVIELQKIEYLVNDNYKTSELIVKYLNQNTEDGLLDYIKTNGIKISKSVYHHQLALYYLDNIDFDKVLQNIVKCNEYDNQKSDIYTSTIYLTWGLALCGIANKKKDNELFQACLEKLEYAEKLNSGSSGFHMSLAKTYSLFSKFKGGDEKALIKSLQQLEFAFTFDKDDKQIAHMKSMVLGDLAILKNEEELYKKSTESFIELIKSNPNNYENLYRCAFIRSKYALLKNDLELHKKSYFEFEKALELNPNSNNAMFFGGVELFHVALLEKDKALYSKGLERFLKLLSMPGVDRNNFDMLKLLIESIYEDFSERINKNQILNIISEVEKSDIDGLLNSWLITALKYSEIFNYEELEKLKRIVKKKNDKYPELAITENYINIYKRLVIDGEKNALYDLPKEQRLFFEENILSSSNN